MSERTTASRLVILGRPNVGKSTLFNRICGRRRSLVGDEPGITRDRIYATADWRGKSFEVIDTGGLIPEAVDEVGSAIFRQARTAMNEAGHWLLVVDGRAGVTAQDAALATELRHAGKPVTLVVNKIDTGNAEMLVPDFYRLGLPDVIAVSAEHGRGVDELLDYVTRDFPDGAAAEQQDDAIRVAIIGRPNAGKSTLLNCLTGEQRSIVTPLPGTTRDAVDADITFGGRRITLIDTAGIRRKGKTRLMAEKLSVVQARKHLERSDVAILVLDATEGVTALDTHIGGYAHESHRAVVVAVNKWDVLKKGPAATADFTRLVREKLKYLGYAQVVFISALKGQRLSRLMEAVIEAAGSRRKRITTAEMNRFLETLDFDRAPSPAGRPLRLYYLTQAAVSPPIFVAFTNRPGPLYFSVARYLENRIRERFGFAGTPIILRARQRGKTRD